MQVKLFQISAGDTGALQEELNVFLRTHRILSVREELVSGSGGVFWCFCVKYVAGEISSDKYSKKGRVDYREKLSEEAFGVFLKLKQCRKEIAEEQSLKLYMIFTNDELAKMAELEELSLDGISKIKGIGEKKLKKYAVPLLEKYQKLKEDETRESSDVPDS